MSIYLNSAVLLMLAPVALAADRYAGYFGNAFEQGSGKMLYSESHFIHFLDDKVQDRVVLYRCPNGRAFARKVLQIKGKPQMPEFELLDQRTGYREGLATRAGKLTVFYQSSAKKSEKSETLDATRVMVADAGFDEFVRSNWARLLEGKAVPLDFVVPSQLDYLGFKVKWLRQSIVEGESAQVFKLAPSGLLGLLTSGLEVTYASADRSLREFEGISNIRDLSGDNYQTKIVFPKGKIETFPDASALAKAKSEALSNSCE